MRFPSSRFCAEKRGSEALGVKGVWVLVPLCSEKLCDLKRMTAPLWALFFSFVDHVQGGLGQKP